MEYRLADDGSMTVLNDTANFYRYFDFTQIVEAFCEAVAQTLRTELLPELDYLVRWERACSRMRDVVDMPGRKVTQFILFTRQNNGVFPKARRNMFPELSDAEIAALAVIVREELVNVSERK